MITKLLKSFDTIVIDATTSNSFTLSLTGFRRIVIPIWSSIACGLSISNKVLYDIVMQKYKKYKKQYEKDQNTMKPFDKLYRKRLQDKVIDKIEYESLCIFWIKRKVKFFYKYEYKKKIKFFY